MQSFFSQTFTLSKQIYTILIDKTKNRKHHKLQFDFKSFPTLFKDNRNGCGVWTTALQDVVGGSAIRIPSESIPANRAGITLKYNFEKNKIKKICT